MKRVALLCCFLLLFCSCSTRHTVATFTQSAIDTAQARIEDGSYGAAIDVLEQTQRVDASQPELLATLALAYALEGRSQNAVDTLFTLLKTDKTRLSACTNVADAMLEQGVTVERVFSLWINANSGDDEAVRAFAQHYIDEGDAEAFKSYCLVWTREDPSSQTAAMALADAYDLLGNAEDAANIRMSFYRRAAEENPNDLEAVKTYADYLMQTGESVASQNELKSYYIKIMDAEPGNRDAMLGLYNIYKSQLDNTSIKFLLETYLAEVPTDAEARQMLNTAMAALGQKVFDPSALPEGAGDVVQVVAGATGMGYLKSSGDLYLWGLNYDGEISGGTMPEETGWGIVNAPVLRMSNIKSFSMGGSVRPSAYGYTLAVTGDNAVYGFGVNVAGILDAPSVEVVLEPKRLLENVGRVSAGFNHAVAVGLDSSLWAWGDNTYGQLGDGTTDASYVPKQIMTGVAKAVAGYGFTVILKLDGSVWICGWNAEDAGYGADAAKQLATPRRLTDKIIDIAANRWDVYLIDESGVLWGYFGTMEPNYPDSITGNGAWLSTGLPTRMETHVKQVDASHGRFGILVKEGGDVMVWGVNGYGCLGLGTGDSERQDGGGQPVAEPTLLIGGAAQASAGAFNGIALMDNGDIITWGMGNGMIGDGFDNGSNKPIPIEVR